ncbi:hypothetical protein FRC17_002909, partial [Serendipita sp. 399]
MNSVAELARESKMRHDSLKEMRKSVLEEDIGGDSSEDEVMQTLRESRKEAGAAVWELSSAVRLANSGIDDSRCKREPVSLGHREKKRTIRVEEDEEVIATSKRPKRPLTNYGGT